MKLAETLKKAKPWLLKKIPAKDSPEAAPLESALGEVPQGEINGLSRLKGRGGKILLGTIGFLALAGIACFATGAFNAKDGMKDVKEAVSKAASGDFIKKVKKAKTDLEAKVADLPAQLKLKEKPTDEGKPSASGQTEPVKAKEQANQEEGSIGKESGADAAPSEPKETDWNLDRSRSEPTIQEKIDAAAAEEDRTVAISSTHVTPEDVPQVSARCEFVFDGDTFDFIIDGQKTVRRGRLAGIDAPERKQNAGSAATANLKVLLYGKQLKISILGKDEFTGVLTVLVDAEGTDPARIQCMQGLAWLNPDDFNIIPEERLELYDNLVFEAQSNRWGLWKKHQAMPPWEFRAKESWRKRQNRSVD